MIIALEIICGLVLLLLISLLAPRLYVAGCYRQKIGKVVCGNPFFLFTYRTPQNRASFRIWGVNFIISSPGGKTAPPKSSPQPSEGGTEPGVEIPIPAKTAKEKPASSGRNRRFVRALFAEKGLSTQLIHLLTTTVKQLISSFSIDRFILELTIATPDPMYTGALFGVLQPLTLINRRPDRIVRIYSDFERQLPTGEGELRISTHPLRLCLVILRLLVHLPYIRLFRVYRALGFRH